MSTDSTPAALLLRPRSPRYESMDLWRGVACLAVVVFHSTFYGTEEAPRPEGLHGKVAWLLLWKGDLGVPIFFVISGYCIAASCDGLRRKETGIRQYFRRRFRRIFPPYLVFWAAAALFMAALTWTGLGHLVSDPPHEIRMPWTLGPAALVGNLTLTEAWLPALRGDPSQWFMGHAWSLGMEEQFYAVCGLALFASRRHFFRSMAVVTAGVAASSVALWGGGYTSLTSGFFFFGLWFGFALGVGAYYTLNYESRRAQWMATGAFVAASLLLIGPLGGSVQPSTRSYGVVGGLTAAALVALHPFDRRIATSRAAAPLMWTGTMCYSLYLTHWPVVKPLSHALHLAGIQGFWPTLFVTLPICLGVALVVGRVFFHLVERRFLNAPLVRAGEVSGLASPSAAAATAS